MTLGAAPELIAGGVRERLESFLLVLAIGAAVAIWAKRAGVAYNVALVVVGVVLVFAEVLPHTPMQAEVILVVLLPLLVFEGALSANITTLRQARRPILVLAIPGVAISLIATAVVAMFALQLPFAVALVMGAVLAITDTVSVLLAFRTARVPRRLAAIMEGESLFNDGTALVLVSVTSGIAIVGMPTAAAALKMLGVAIVGGGLLGAAFGAAGAALLRRTPDHLTAILASAVLVFATSLIAEHLDASPVIAVVVAGLFVGTAARRFLEPSRVLALHGFWETLAFGVNVLLFLLVGMQLDAPRLLAEAPSILIAVLALHAGRAVAVYGSFGVLKLLRMETVPVKWQHVMVLGNVKGALSMAAVLALPEGLPYRDRLVAIVFGATFVTLVTQALPFRRILGLLGLGGGRDDAARDRARAILVAARRGQIEVDELLSTGLVSRRDHAERRAEFQRKIIGAEEELRAHPSTGTGDAVVEAWLLNAQKGAVLDASHRGLISGEVAAELANELDRVLLARSGQEELE
jgi:CPA1 family monovalent cation:H+ antiporter